MRNRRKYRMGNLLIRTDVISRSDWLGALGIALSLVSILLGIVNNRRILADKRPWGDLCPTFSTAETSINDENDTSGK